MRARAKSFLCRGWRCKVRPGTSGFDWTWGIRVEGQSRLQIGGRSAAAASAIILKPAGNFPPPFRLDGQVSFGLSDHSARKRRAPRGAQRGVAETADIGRIAV